MEIYRRGRDVGGEIKATTLFYWTVYELQNHFFKHRMNGAIKKWNNHHIFKMF